MNQILRQAQVLLAVLLAAAAFAQVAGDASSISYLDGDVRSTLEGDLHGTVAYPFLTTSAERVVEAAVAPNGKFRLGLPSTLREDLLQTVTPCGATNPYTFFIAVVVVGEEYLPEYVMLGDPAGPSHAMFFYASRASGVFEECEIAPGYYNTVELDLKKGWNSVVAEIVHDYAAGTVHATYRTAPVPSSFRWKKYFD